MPYPLHLWPAPKGTHWRIVSRGVGFLQIELEPNYVGSFEDRIPYYKSIYNKATVDEVAVAAWDASRELVQDYEDSFTEVVETTDNPELWDVNRKP